MQRGETDKEDLALLLFTVIYKPPDNSANIGSQKDFFSVKFKLFSYPTI